MTRTISNARTLGAFIKDARIQQGLTQQQLAEQAGVSRSWLIGVEQGKRSGAEMSKIFALLNVLQIPMLFEEPTPTAPTSPAQESPREEGSPSAFNLPPADPLSAVKIVGQASGSLTNPDNALDSLAQMVSRRENANKIIRDLDASPALNAHDLGVKALLQFQAAAWAAPSGITAALNQEKASEQRTRETTTQESDDSSEDHR